MAYTEHQRSDIEECIKHIQNEYLNNAMVAHVPHEIRYVEAAAMVMRYGHFGQLLKSGERYYTHTQQVGDELDNPLAKQVGYLHDVLENSNITIDDLRRMGFSEPVLKSLEVLTKRKGELYLDYLERINQSNDTIAMQVKLVDMMHNNSPERQPAALSEGREEKRAMRRECYSIGIPYLKQAIFRRNSSDPAIVENVKNMTVGQFMYDTVYLKNKTLEQIEFVKRTVKANSSDVNIHEIFPIIDGLNSMIVPPPGTPTPA